MVREPRSPFGEYLVPMGRVKLGIALELYRQHDDLQHGDARVERAFVGGALKLKIETEVLK